MAITMKSYREQSSQLRYHYSGSVADATTSTPVLLPGLDSKASVAVQPGTDVTIEFTLSHPGEVAAGNAAWLQLEAGITASKAQELPVMATAVRLTANGAASWQVLA